jgi:O-methyltransferase
MRFAGLEISRVRTEYPPDFDSETVSIIESVRPFTMTSPERLFGLIRAVEYIIKAAIPGAFVECGVWRGGSMMAVAEMLIRLSATERSLFLFDTYGGMPEPGSEDRDLQGSTPDLEKAVIRCEASLQDVQHNLLSTAYPRGNLNFVKGKVEDTIPHNTPQQIALLRLDTDWYESTKHELEHLYPRLSSGGVLIIDDYGHWRGSRKAVDEYFAERAILLNRMDYTGRISIKTSAESNSSFRQR